MVFSLLNIIDFNYEFFIFFYDMCYDRGDVECDGSIEEWYLFSWRSVRYYWDFYMKNKFWLDIGLGVGDRENGRSFRKLRGLKEYEKSEIL